ncbi:MAG TPA: hypothetical protein VHQ69_16550 [Methylomirabilota bacterium]|nr:hypothetical protein [Methylomirabilota bacterium]
MPDRPPEGLAMREGRQGRDLRGARVSRRARWRTGGAAVLGIVPIR